MSILFGAPALLALVLNLWQWLAAGAFPLHTRLKALHSAPGVTLLKPLKGCDSETESCLRSWFAQEYAGPVQILLGVASGADPVCALVHRLIQEYTAQNARLIICEPLLGPNAKVSTLAHLSKHRINEYLVVSDADVYAPPDLLANLAASLQKPEAGLVNCFYKLAPPASLATQWEALAVNADFWSQVLQGNSLKKMDFALGAVMATTQSHLQKIGGFESLLEYLADDYQLGHRVAKTGARITICPVVVECRSEPASWASIFSHQLRWARTIRVCQPAAYFFSILANATLWPLLFAVTAKNAFSASILVFALILRILTAGNNYSRLTRDNSGWRAAWFAPIKDLLQCVLWALSFIGNKIQWRGRRFLVAPDGKLQAIPLK